MDVAGALRLLGPPDRIAHGLRRRVHDELGLDCAVGIGRSKMIAKLASRAAKPRASRAGLEPGPRRLPGRAGRRARVPARPRRRGAVGRGPGHGEAPARPGRAHGGRPGRPPARHRGAPAGKASGAHLAALARGEDPDPVNPNRPNKSIGHEETFSQDLVDPHELERHVAAHGRVGGDHAAGRLDLRPDDHGEGQVQGPLVADALAHPRRARSRPVAPSGRWRPRCWPASTRARASACSGSAPRGWAPAVWISSPSISGTGSTRTNQSATAREQSWQDVTAAVDAIRTRFGRGAVGSAGHGHRGGGAGAGPARRAVGAGRVAGHQRIQYQSEYVQRLSSVMHRCA